MKYVLSAAMLVAIAMPVSAQMTDGMKSPTMKQCQAGYKPAYMKTMKWSSTAFSDACSEKMKMNKDKKMKKDKI